MRGVVIGFLPGARGVIRAEDGKRYEFANSEWHSARTPTVGDEVDFEAMDGQATSIFAVRPMPSSGAAAAAAARAAPQTWVAPGETQQPPPMMEPPPPRQQYAVTVPEARSSGGAGRGLIFLLAVVVLVACFLPVYDLGLGGGLRFEFAGEGSIYAIARDLPDTIQAYDSIGGSFFQDMWPQLALLLIPLFAVFAILGAAVGSGRFFALLTGLAALLLPAGMLGYTLSQMGFPINLPDIVRRFGIGGWVITGSGVLMLIAAAIPSRRY